MNRFSLRLIGATGLLVVGMTAGGTARAKSQTQPQSASRPLAVGTNNAASAAAPKPKAKKVWSDDDLIRIRKPADVQQDGEAEAHQKESAASAKPADAGAPAALPTKLSDNSLLPATVGEAEQKIGARQQERDHIKQELESTNQRYHDATDQDQLSQLKITMDLQQDELREANDDLTLLQARLAELKKASKRSKAATSGPKQSNPEAGNPQS